MQQGYAVSNPFQAKATHNLPQLYDILSSPPFYVYFSLPSFIIPKSPVQSSYAVYPFCCILLSLFYPIPHSLAPFTHYISFLAIPLTHVPPLINIQAFSVVRLILFQLQHLLTPSIHRDQWSIRDP